MTGHLSTIDRHHTAWQGRAGSGREQPRLGVIEMDLTVEAMETAYARAEAIGSGWNSLVDNETVTPAWDTKSAGLWYRSQTPRGWQFVAVPLPHGTIGPAFDHGRLASLLAEETGKTLQPDRLPLANLQLDGGIARFDALDRMWVFNPQVDLLEGLGTQTPSEYGVRVSPDGTKRAQREGHDVRMHVTIGESVRLTTDGAPFRSYGGYADAFVPFQAQQLSGSVYEPFFGSWSPDSRFLLTYICDQSHMSDLWLLETSPLDNSRPRLRTYKYGLPGEEMPLGTWVAFDTVASTAIHFTDSQVLLRDHPELLLSEIRWSSDSRFAFLVDHDRDPRVQRLQRLDVATGDVTTVLTERGERGVQRRLFGAHPYAVLDGGAAIMWWSERSGRGHLYHYQVGSEETPRQITAGDFSIRSVEHVDESTGSAIVTVAGLCDWDPYFRAAARLSLDSGELAILSDVNFDHVINVSPDGRWLLDTASTFTDSPTTAVIDSSGKVLAELEAADSTRLVELGWSPPERVRTKSADGKTDVYSLVYKPHGFNPEHSYPVVEHIYPGPQLTRAAPFTPRDTAFGARAIFGASAEALAALGFVVVLIDGRGTPGRDRSFLDYAFGNLDDASCLADHVATHKELAASRPWMDLNRVGICGASGGGFMTARAMMRYPEFYRVGVAAAGNHDMYRQNAAWPEVFDGVPDTAPQRREREHDLNNSNLVNHLEGKLLLIHGAMDENVPLHQTLGLVQSLVEADKDFDLLILPRGDHRFNGCENYATRRTWDYLVEHLHGAQPPRHRFTHESTIPLMSAFDGADEFGEPASAG